MTFDPPLYLIGTIVGLTIGMMLGVWLSRRTVHRLRVEIEEMEQRLERAEKSANMFERWYLQSRAKEQDQARIIRASRKLPSVDGHWPTPASQLPAPRQPAPVIHHQTVVTPAPSTNIEMLALGAVAGVLLSGDGKSSEAKAAPEAPAAEERHHSPQPSSYDPPSSSGYSGGNDSGGYSPGGGDSGGVGD